MNVTIRAAEPRDAARLVELAAEVGAEPEGWLIGNGEWHVADERRYLKSLRRGDHGAVLVATVDGEIVGRLSISRDTHPASEHVAGLGLMVAREHRGRGIGRALMERAEAWARGVGIRKIELYVFPQNEAAIALYDHLGYERIGLRRRHYQRRGGLVDAVLMEKEL